MSATPTPNAPAAGAPPPNMRALREKLATARAVVVACWPFLAPAAFRLAPRWTTAVPTMAVDRWWRLYLNPEYVSGLTPNVLAVLIAGHELQHALMNHCDRLGEYRGRTIVINGVPADFANVAHDLAINSGLRAFADAGVAYRRTLGKDPPALAAPDDALYPEQFQDETGTQFPVGLVSEGYAALLARAPKMDGGSAGNSGTRKGGEKRAACGQCGSMAGDRNSPWEENDQPDPADPHTGTSAQEQEVIRRQVADAAIDQEGRHRGTVPGGVHRWAKARVDPPKIDWRKELAREVRVGVNWAAGRTQYSYVRPHRRSIAVGSAVILPGMFTPDPKFGVVLDTSGSMGLGDYNRIFSELKGILKTVGCRRVPVLACDAAVSAVQWVSRIEEVKLHGGGGTDMRVGIEAAVRQLGVRLVIVCSDLETPWPPGPIAGERVIAVSTRPSSRANRPPAWIKTIYAYDR